MNALKEDGKLTHVLKSKSNHQPVKLNGKKLYWIYRARVTVTDVTVTRVTVTIVTSLWHLIFNLERGTVGYHSLTAFLMLALALVLSRIVLPLKLVDRKIL